MNIKKYKKIGVVTDEDFGVQIVKNRNQPKLRYGARGIVFNENNEVAVFFKKLKKEYKLPGGGIEDGESPKDSFKRECEEELGVKIDIVDFLGTIEEVQSQTNFKQISYVFVAKVIEKTKQNLTQMEKDEGATSLWVNIDEALNLISSCINDLRASNYESVYSTKFIVLRDRKILEYYLNNNEN